MTATTFQIGKAGVTPGVVEALNNLLEHHKHIRITVLKSSGRNREVIREMAQELVGKLKVSCVFTIIGFTIVLRRRLSQEDKK